MTFETLYEGDVLSSQFASIGIVVSGSPMVLTAGSLLNDIDYPPHSGTNVLADVGGPILFEFAPVGAGSVSGFFTYSTPLTFQVFSTGGSLLATSFSSGVSNFGSLEQFSFSSSTETIGYFWVAGAAAGLGPSFTLDDLTFSQVPEPSSLLLVVPVAAFMLSCCRKKGRR